MLKRSGVVTVSDPDRKVPGGLKAAGRRLWSAVVEEFELTEPERVLLLQVCRKVDDLEVLHALVQAEGVVVRTPQGDKAHPALAESRQQQLVLARLLAALGVDESGNGTGAKGKPKGVYRLRGVS